MKGVYLDYASTTPIDPRVMKAMESYFTEEFGNPGSLHSFGQKASAAVFSARQTIAKALNCHYSNIIFTGSATEANNLALRSVTKGRIIVSSIEHESVLKVPDVVITDIKKIQSAINRDTALVSVMYANNETGSIQPIKEISKLIQNSKFKIQNSASTYPLFHVDAVQAFNYLKCDVNELGVDMMTISAHKIYGPKGIGALYVKNPELLSPMILGGGQEGGVRSGTENVPAIVGFGKAVELVEETREKESKRIKELRDYAWKGIKKIFPKASLNGSGLPNNINFYIPGVSGEQILVALDFKGIAISSGSACTARSTNPSHALLAMGYDKIRAKNSLRVTLGRPTTKSEIDYFLKTLFLLS